MQLNYHKGGSRFQPGEGPSRGHLREYEIFANLCLTSTGGGTPGGGEMWSLVLCDQHTPVTLRPVWVAALYLDKC